MSVIVHCPCGQKMQVMKVWTGKRITCPTCKQILTLPSPPNAASKYRLPWLVVAGLSLLVVFAAWAAFGGARPQPAAPKAVAPTPPPASPLQPIFPPSRPSPVEPPSVIPPPSQPPSPPSRTGTITFAEYVDPKTFQTRNEGRIFSRGWVNLLVRTNRPFEDTKLVVSCRMIDGAVWQIVDSSAIDPNWATTVSVIYLNVPGTYHIRATTGQGEVVAADVVTIVPYSAIPSDSGRPAPVAPQRPSAQRYVVTVSKFEDGRWQEVKSLGYDGADYDAANAVYTLYHSKTDWNAIWTER